MPWIETPNVAQYQGSDWANYIRTVPNCSPAQAKVIAAQDPTIAYFFYCRDFIILTNGRSFNPGDAVFFNGTQTPWYGSAPQCDSYQRICLSVGYAESTIVGVNDAATLTYNGEPALDLIVVVANLNLRSTSLPPATQWMDPTAPGPTMLTANDTVIDLLNSHAIQQARDLGIAVVLCGLNNHDAAGWSEFTDPLDARQFAAQCEAVRVRYGLDGIDIDDEYSAGIPNNDSLAMVTYYVRNAIGTASFSKALFADTEYFAPTYEGTSLGTNLTWGWTMSYGEGPQYQLPPYDGLMPNGHLLSGFAPAAYQPTQVDIAWMHDNGYAGIMIFIPTSDHGVMLGTLLSYWPLPPVPIIVVGNPSL